MIREEETMNRPNPEPISLRTRLWNILRYKLHDVHHGVEPQEGRYASEMQEPRGWERREPAPFLFLTRRGVALAGLLSVLCVVGYQVIGSEGWFQDHYPTLSAYKNFTREVLTGADLNSSFSSAITGVNNIIAKYPPRTREQPAGETTFVTGVITRRFK